MSNKPVAWRFHDGAMWCYVNHLVDLPAHKFEPLYTHPVDDTALLRQCFEAMQDIERTGDVQVFCMCDVPKLFPALRERLGEKT
jgi:hypothetical protein